MIWFFTPYSFNKKLFEAYDAHMMLIPDPEDWGCLMDGDMAFLMSDFGQQIQEYIDKYPETGMFSCYANRNPYGHQMRPELNAESDSIRYVYQNAVEMREKYHLKATNCQRRIAGFLMVIKKATWLKYREEIAAAAESANIQAVDTAISDVLIKHDERIRLMDGMQVFHYYRQYSMTEKHILSDKLTVVIRTHDRPKMFKRCIQSVRQQTHKNIDIVVGVDTPGSLRYAKTSKPTRIVQCTPRDRIGKSDFPANEYISELIRDINDGFILILDDDNFIPDPEGVEKLFKQIDKEWCVYIIRYQYPDGRLFPNNNLFTAKQIKDGGVDWASCVFHARFKNLSKSLPLYNADYHFISNMVRSVKTTKWIDLSLVHTETPANDGKTEKEMIKPNDPVRTHDVVYVLGNGSQWGNNELRFSIRSFKKYFKNLRNIVVVGERPDWLQNAIHIAMPEPNGGNKDARMAFKILAACKDYRVSENFIYCYDDTALLKPLQAKDFKGWHEGPISYDVKSDEKDHRSNTPHTTPYSSEWFTFVYNTGNELKSRGLPDKNYDKAHCPQPVNKAEFISVMNDWDMMANKFTVTNVYNNSSKIFSGENIRGRHLKIYGELTKDEIHQLTKGKNCINYNDRGLTETMKAWLYETFPEPTIYEAFITEATRRQSVEKWFEKGCNYEEGLAIFKHFAPKNGHLIRYFELKRNNESADKKLKSTLQLWLR